MTMSVIVVLVLLLAFMLFGVPVGFAIGGATMAAMWFCSDLNMVVNAQYCYSGIFSFTVMAPLLLPAVQALGIDPVHFGVIMSVNLAIGRCSPPYGCNLFVGAAVAKIKMESMFKWIVPYFAIAIFALLLITFFEPLTMILV